MARLLFTGKAAGTYDPISGLKNRDELSKSLAVPTTIFMKQVHMSVYYATERLYMN